MAKKVTVTLSDDLNPDLPADDTITFTIDGVGYEIDLNQENITKFHDTFTPWINSARPVNGKRRRRITPRPNGDLAAIRAWAGENGITVSARGRISNDVIAAYHKRQEVPVKKPGKSRVERALDKAATKVDLPAFSNK